MYKTIIALATSVLLSCSTNGNNNADTFLDSGTNDTDTISIDSDTLFDSGVDDTDTSTDTDTIDTDSQTEQNLLQIIELPNTYLVSEALEVCNTYEDTYNDWRLPTIDEQRKIINGCDSTTYGGLCDVLEGSDITDYSSNCAGCDSFDGCYLEQDLDCGDSFNDKSYISASSFTDEFSNAFNWGVGFVYGDVLSIADDDITQAYVLCIRE